MAGDPQKHEERHVKVRLEEAIMRMYPNEHLPLWGHLEDYVEGAWSDPREEEARLFIQFPKRQW